MRPRVTSNDNENERTKPHARKDFFTLRPGGPCFVVAAKIRDATKRVPPPRESFTSWRAMLCRGREDQGRDEARPSTARIIHLLEGHALSWPRRSGTRRSASLHRGLRKQQHNQT